MSESDVQAVLSAIDASSRYRGLCPDTVRRVARQELARQRNLKAAVKATKRRLHQVYGAFEVEANHDRLVRLFQAALDPGRAGSIKEACWQVLDLHSSTRERKPILPTFYPAIWNVTGPPASVLDLGCGLNPFALPWMDLPPGAPYLPLDIDCERIAFVNRCLALMGHAAQGRCQDLLAAPPADEAGVALLLKMSPTLERQEEGATLRLVQGLRVAFVVVSFAVKSLTGREKGMVEHYGQQFAALARGQRWPVTELRFDSELAFVVDKT